MNSLAGLLQQIRIEGENALENFLRPVLFGCVNCRETFACVVDDDCVAEEDLILGSYVVEDGGDCGEADVERIQRMLHDRPQFKLQQELQVCVASRQLAASERDDVENRLTNRVENDVRFRVLVAVEVAVLDVVVRPAAELSEVKFDGVECEEVRAREEAREVTDGGLTDCC